MQIDIFNDRLLTFSQAAKALPNRPAVSTIWRWHQAGVQGVRLPAIKVGGVFHTSEAALQWFCDQLTAQAEGERPSARPSHFREREIAAAEKKLSEMGV